MNKILDITKAVNDSAMFDVSAEKADAVKHKDWLAVIKAKPSKKDKSIAVSSDNNSHDMKWNIKASVPEEFQSKMMKETHALYMKIAKADEKKDWREIGIISMLLIVAPKKLNSSQINKLFKDNAMWTTKNPKAEIITEAHDAFTHFYVVWEYVPKK